MNVCICMSSYVENETIHGSLTKVLRPCAGSGSFHTVALGGGPEGGRTALGGDSAGKRKHWGVEISYWCRNYPTKVNLYRSWDHECLLFEGLQKCRNIIGKWWSMGIVVKISDVSQFRIWVSVNIHKRIYKMMWKPDQGTTVDGWLILMRSGFVADQHDHFKLPHHPQSLPANSKTRHKSLVVIVHAHLLVPVLRSLANLQTFWCIFSVSFTTRLDYVCTYVYVYL